MASEPQPGHDSWPGQRRETLEREADSDTAAAWVCQRLLDSLDSLEGGS